MTISRWRFNPFIVDGSSAGIVFWSAWIVFFLSAFVAVTYSASTPSCTDAQVADAIIVHERTKMGELERRFWLDAIGKAALAHGLPVDIVTAKIAVESGYYGRARSNKGAVGAAQLMPMWVKGFDPMEIEVNLDKGAEVLAYELSQTGGDIYRALRRYNGGPNGDRPTATGAKAYADAVLAKAYLARYTCKTSKETQS